MGGGLMPYGFPSNDTTRTLRENGFDFAWNTSGRPTTTYLCSIICSGALDEEFDLNDMYLPRDIGLCIFKALADTVEELHVIISDSDGTTVWEDSN
jgi:hypothetical protein